jgi:FecR protein
MNDEQSRAALASLGGPLVMSDAEAHERQRHQVLPHLRQLVRGIPARRRRKIWQRRAFMAGGLVASSALAFSVWVGLTRRAAPFEVEQGPAASQSDERHGYATGADVGATLRTRQGARVSLAAHTRLSAVSSETQHELLQLAAGSLSIRVPKLGTGATFAVQTPDSIVTVHGTVFSVTVLGAGSLIQTCVAVSEGLVAVEHGGKRTMVGAGEQKNCRPEPATPTVPAIEPVDAPGSATAASPAPASTSPPDRHATAKQSSSLPSPVPETDESLAAQNRLLATALQAERAGRFAEARSQLQELLARYPASPLRTDAERSLARVSRKLP